MGLRWGAVRRRTPSSRNDHIHLFSTANNARRLREALRQVEEGRVHRMSLEEICARFGLERFVLGSGVLLKRATNRRIASTTPD